MPPPAEAALTDLLHRSAGGDCRARDQLWDHLHEQLRGMARRRLLHDRLANCDPTELVHEAFFKLDNLKVTPHDRLHFLGLAARAMRQVLIDQARQRQRDKRGGGRPDVTLHSEWIDADRKEAIDVFDLDHAMESLARLDARKAEVVELSYFGGLTDEEVAELVGVSVATVKRDLRTARAWLASELQ
jgi:RNA polymerase sigma factor (TIGR02999 family)